jgi:D-alanyl-D-alanine carboxypeptidase
VTSAVRAGRSVITVVMGEQTREATYVDTEKLLEFGFAFLRAR